MHDDRTVHEEHVRHDVAGVTATPVDDKDALKQLKQLFDALERTSAEVCRDAKMKTAIDTANWTVDDIGPAADSYGSGQQYDQQVSDVSCIHVECVRTPVL